jgi:uncharacterized membrane protein
VLATREENMADKIQELSKRLMNMQPSDLTPSERRVLDKIASRTRISRNLAEPDKTKMTLGARVADRVAAFGGSWTFIIIFVTILLAWVATNVVLNFSGRAFDPYPFIFLNLILSMVAALQAPIIMMSQNRQSEKDRIAAAHDYEINLKAELEILALHEKMDDLRQEKLVKLMEQQEEQLVILRKLTAAKTKEKAPAR